MGHLPLINHLPFTYLELVTGQSVSRAKPSSLSRHLARNHALPGISLSRFLSSRGESPFRGLLDRHALRQIDFADAADQRPPLRSKTSVVRGFGCS